MLVVYNPNPGLAGALNRILYNDIQWKTYIYRRCCPFSCTVSVHRTYVDVLKGYHYITLSKIMGHILVLTISLLNWVDALVLLTGIYNILGTA